MSTVDNEPIAVVQAFDDACNTNDTERALAFFTDDAVLTQLPPQPYQTVLTGKQAIRAWLEPQMQQHLHVESRNFRVEGETVTWDATVYEDTVRQMGIESFEVIAEGTVQKGKITSFTLTQPPETISKFQQAMAQGGAGSSEAS